MSTRLINRLILYNTRILCSLELVQPSKDVQFEFHVFFYRFLVEFAGVETLFGDSSYPIRFITQCFRTCKVERMFRFVDMPSNISFIGEVFTSFWCSFIRIDFALLVSPMYISHSENNNSSIRFSIFGPTESSIVACHRLVS